MKQRRSRTKKSTVPATRVTSRKFGRAKGINGINFMDPLLVAGGAIGGRFLNGLFPNMDPKLKAGAKVALGIGIPMFIKSPKTKSMAAHLGYGLVANGAVELAQEFGVLGKVGELEDNDFLVVSLEGVGSDSTIDIPFEDMNDVVNDDILNGNEDVDVVNEDVSVVNDDILN